MLPFRKFFESLLLQHAGYHKTFPLLYNTLKKVCPDMVPDAFLQQLKSSYMENAAHSFFLAGMLIKVLHILKQHNIPAVPFKGPVFTGSFFILPKSTGVLESGVVNNESFFTVLRIENYSKNAIIHNNI